MMYDRYHDQDTPRLSVNAIKPLLLACPKLEELILPFGYDIEMTTGNNDAMVLPSDPITSADLREFELNLNWSFIHPPQVFKWTDDVVLSLLSVLPFNCIVTDVYNGIVEHSEHINPDRFEAMRVAHHGNLATISRHIRLRSRQWSLLNDYHKTQACPHDSTV